MSQQRLTDRSLAPYITGDTLIHIVNTGDTTQYAGGSSYKATIDQVSDYYLNNYDVYITGTTFGSNQSVVTRNDGFDVFKLSGGSNVTLTNPSTNQILIDVAIPPDTNTYVTGGTLVGADLILDWNTGGSVPPIDLSALSGVTYWTSGSSGNYSLKTINDSTVDSLGDYTISSGYNNLAAGDYSSIIGGENNTIDNVDKASIIGSNYGIISGSTPSSSEGSSIFGGYATNLISPSKILEGVASTIVGGFRNNIEYNSISIVNGGGLNSIIKSYTPHLPIDNWYNSILGGQLNVIDTGKSDSIIGGRLNKITYNAPLSGFSTGNIIAGGDGNLIDGHSNSAIIGGINNTINFDLISNNGIFVGDGNTITGGGYDSIVGGTGNTINGDPILSADFGNTIIGGKDNTIFTGATSTIIGGKNNVLISNTGPNFRIENSVILGGQNLTGTTDDTVYVPYLNINNLGLGTPINNLGIDSNGFVVVGTSGETDTNTFVTGGTYSAGTATFTNNTGGTFNVTGFTEPFTGNTSGDCINDIYVKNIHSCSPLNINPLDEGNVYFGSTSGVTIDVINKRLGINTLLPNYNVEVFNDDLTTSVRFDLTPTIKRLGAVSTTSTGLTEFFASTNYPSLGGYGSFSMGVIGESAVVPGIVPERGVNGDTYIYTSARANGLNIINKENPSGTEDYIRFYAGQDANGTTPDIHIQGSGATRGFVGLNNENPLELLHTKGGDVLFEQSSGKFFTDIQNATGPATVLSGNTTGVSRIGVVVPTYDSVSLGVRGPSAGFPGYGKQGDAFIYSSNANNGFNVISQPGTGTDDYIRFFAGQASGAAGTPDIHIQGSGSTRGFVGFGLGSPTSKVDITTANGYQQLRLRQSYTPTSTADTNGNVGDVAWDDTYFYIKTNTGWGRLALDYVF